MRDTTHYVWCESDQGSSHWPQKSHGGSIFKRLGSCTRRICNELNHVHFFLNRYCLQRGTANELLRYPRFFPKRITVTIRHVDWDISHRDIDLGMDTSWIHDFFLPSTCTLFEMELETNRQKKRQLDRIVQKLTKEHFNIACSLDEDFFSCRAKPQVSFWKGKNLLDRWPKNENKTIEYYVVNLRWERYPANMWDEMYPGVKRGGVEAVSARN